MDNDKVIPTVRLFGRRKHDPSKEVCFGHLDTVGDAHYVCHAANVLPELVAAAKNLQQNWEKNLTEPMARLNQALVLAESVDQGEAKKTPNQRSTPDANGTHHS